MDGTGGTNGYPEYGHFRMDEWEQLYVPRRDPEEEVKEAKKHFSKLGLMFILGTIVVYGVQLLVIAAVGVFRPRWLWNPDILLMLSVLPMYLVGMPVMILLVKQVPAEKIQRRPMKAGSFVVAAIMCYAIVYLSNLAGNLMTWIIGALKGSPVQNEIANVASSVSMWMVVGYMVICAPFMEEYVFRKLIVDRTVKYGQGTAVLLSGLMFGLFHGNLNQFVYAFTLGMFLAFLYVKTGKLKITIALHMMINFTGGVVTTWLMDMLDLNQYLRLIARGADMESIMAYMNEHILGWIAYMLFLIFVVGITIAGGVLLIVFLAKKKFTFARGSVELPKGRRFRTVLLNVGMVLYSLFWIAMILWQLFGDDIRALLYNLTGGRIG